MKRAIEIDNELFDTLHETAQREHVELSSFVEEAIREKIDRLTSHSTSDGFKLEVCRLGGGVHPSVNLDKTSELLDL